MALINSLELILDEAKKNDEFWMDSAKLDFAIALEAKRREINKSYADLARALNTSNAYITKVFRGDANLTIESMVKLSRAVECNLDIGLRSMTVKKIDYSIFKKYLTDKTIPEKCSSIESVIRIGKAANDEEYLCNLAQYN